MGAAPDSPVAREYRIGELAREAGITVRTLRYYQERKLLPPPRREGRVGWYSEAHLTRLRVIGQLLDRGHTLGGTAELLAAWEQGYGLAELLGFERAMTAPWSDAATEQLTAAEAAALFGGELTPELLNEAARLGYIEVGSNETLNVSRRLLDTTAALVREGIPLPAILAAGREVQAGLDELASLFVELFISHSGRDTDVARLAETITRLRPVARAVIDEEFARAMDRRAQASYAEFMRLLTARDRSEPEGRGGAWTVKGERVGGRGATREGGAVKGEGEAGGAPRRRAQKHRAAGDPGGGDAGGQPCLRLPRGGATL